MTRSAMAPKGSIVAIAALAGLAASASAYVSYVPTSIAQTGTSGVLGPGMGAQTFDATLATSIFGWTPVINMGGDVLFIGVSDTPNQFNPAAAKPQGAWRHANGGGNINLFLAGDAMPAAISGSGSNPVISNGNVGTGASYTTGNFQNGFMNNSGQYMVQNGSTRANLINTTPWLGTGTSVRDGYRDQVTPAFSDDAPGTSANASLLKYGNIGSNTTKWFNQGGHWAFNAQLSANPAGAAASLPAYINTTSNSAPTSDLNNGGLFLNTGGVTQVASRSSDRLLDLDPTGNTKLGGSGGQAPGTVALNDNDHWVQVWNGTQGNNVYNTSGQAVTGSTNTVATNPNYNPTNVQVNTNNAVIISNRTGTASRTVDGMTGFASLSGLDVIARGGQVAADGAGSPNASGYRIRQFTNTIGFNNNGRVAYGASINAANGGGTTTANIAAYNTQVSGIGLYSDIGTGTIHLVGNTVMGGALPAVWDSTGTTSGVAWSGTTWGLSTATTSSPVSQWVLDGGDHITFSNSAAVTGGTDTGSIETGSPARSSGLFQVGPDGKLRLMAQTGQVAPGATSATGLNADHIYFSSGVTSGFTANSLGQVAFVATLSAPAATAPGAIVTSGGGINNRAVYASDLDGSLVKVMQLGQAWVDGLGITRYVLGFASGFSNTGGQDGKGVSFNDNGDLVFSIYYTNTQGTTTIDGAAVVVTHIPTPGTLALLGLAGVVAGRRRR